MEDFAGKVGALEKLEGILVYTMTGSIPRHEFNW